MNKYILKQIISMLGDSLTLSKLNKRPKGQLQLATPHFSLIARIITHSVWQSDMTVVTELQYTQLSALSTTVFLAFVFYDTTLIKFSEMERIIKS